MASIEISKGGPVGQTIPLQGDNIVLGRNPDCQVVINGTSVSRAHATIVKIQGQYYIEDLKSRNGTLVNNEAIKVRTLLKDDDKIKICDFICTFHDGTIPEPLPADLDEEEAEEELATAAAAPIEAMLSHSSTKMILDAQPAEKLKTLLEITNNLSNTLEIESLLPKIAESLFQLYRGADRCFIILSEEGGKRLIPKVIRTRRASDETNARFSRRIVHQCMESVQALLSDDASSDSRFAMSQSIADFRIRSVMCAPLWTQDGKGMGVIQLDTQDRGKKFTQEDLQLLMGVAGQASVALENAKLHQDLLARERLKRDMELARDVQRSFLPSKAPEARGYEFYAHYESAYEVGGDYYDFVPLPNHRLAIMLGDVAGKGVPAALLMAKISSDARYCMLTQPDPASAITELNALVNHSGLMERFVTLACAVLDFEHHVVTLVNAGHPSPILYRPSDGKLEDAISMETTGMPLGVLDDIEYASCQVELRPGDSIVIFSDGVTDAMDIHDVALQTKGVHAALRAVNLSPKGLGERLLRVVKQHAAGRSQHDDITLVSFGRVDHLVEDDPVTKKG